MVLEILLECNAARHDGREIHVVHQMAAMVGGKVFFDNLFCDPPMPAARPVRVVASIIVFTSLLSAMVIYFINISCT